VAQLKGKSDTERARELGRIAHPAWRDSLAETSLRLDLVDLGEDLLVLREAVGHLVVVGHLPVDLHVKMPPAPSLRSAVMPYWFLMAACKLEAWGGSFTRRST